MAALKSRAGYAAVAAVALVLGVLGIRSLGSAHGADLTLRMQDASGLQVGAPVYVNGQSNGSVSSIKLNGDQAFVGVQFKSGSPAIHQNAAAIVQWRSVLGMRVVNINPGTKSSPALASDSALHVQEEQVDVDDVLAALDPRTRAHLRGLVQGLNSTLAPVQSDLNRTVGVSGPALDQLGKIVTQIDSDGYALNHVVKQVDALVTPLADRHSALTRSVSNLTGFAGAVARHQNALSNGLSQLPSTIKSADKTFRAVPPAVKQASPLLRDLRPVAARLKPVSRELAPVLVDLRPTVANLRPVLGQLDNLLEVTPSLLRNSHAVLPGLSATLKALVPAVSFLRPYTPDLIGWLSNWASAFSYYDAQGHYASAVIRLGPQAFDDNPGIPGTVSFDPAPYPGTAGRTPWTDANGSTMR